MVKALSFIKMHGLGNDFIVLDDFVLPNADWNVHPSLGDVGPLTPEIARELCDRRFGIGADQVLWLRRPKDETAHVRMEIMNADGSTAEMCGNGIRAVGLYLAEEAHEHRHDYRVETLAGLLTVKITGEASDRRAQVAVDMGPPKFGPQGYKGEALTVRGREFRFHEVSMGNPHAVIFTENEDPMKLASDFGPEIEKLPRFPNRTNVEFVTIENPGRIVVRVWERGSGLTLACGTGACAAAVATLATGRAKGPLSVNLPGGDLRISWQEGSSVVMEGPAVEVCRGQYFLKEPA